MKPMVHVCNMGFISPIYFSWSLPWLHCSEPGIHLSDFSFLLLSFQGHVKNSPYSDPFTDLMDWLAVVCIQFFRLIEEVSCQFWHIRCIGDRPLGSQIWKKIYWKQIRDVPPGESIKLNQMVNTIFRRKIMIIKLLVFHSLIKFIKFLII